MTYRGTVNGNTIVLDEALPCGDGMRVELDLAPDRQSLLGSTEELLRLSGAMTREDAGVRRQPEASRPGAEGGRAALARNRDPRPQRGSPQAILQLVGTLTDVDADAILRGARECRRIDWSLWQDMA